MMKKKWIERLWYGFVFGVMFVLSIRLWERGLLNSDGGLLFMSVVFLVMGAGVFYLGVFRQPKAKKKEMKK